MSECRGVCVLLHLYLLCCQVATEMSENCRKVLPNWHFTTNAARVEERERESGREQECGREQRSERRQANNNNINRAQAKRQQQQ